MQKISGILFLLALVFFVLFFGLQHYGQQYKIISKSTASKPVKIAWIGPLSGTAAVLGADNLKAVKLALSEYETGKKPDDPEIQLLSFDDQYNAENTVAIFNKILTENQDIVVVFITDYSAFNLLKNNPKLNKVIIIDPTDNDQYLASIHKNIFLIAKRTEELAALLVEAINNSNAGNAAVFYFRDDNFMPDVAKIMSQILHAEGINSQLYPYSSQTNNFISLLKQARDKKSDAYIFLGYDEIGLAMKQMRELGITAQIYAINISQNIKKNAEGASNGAIIAYFTSLDGNVLFARNFLKKYKMKYGEFPDTEWVALQAYDAANILIKALLATKNDHNNRINNIRNFILNISDYKGVSGDITIVPSGSSRGIFPGIYYVINGQPVRKQ